MQTGNLESSLPVETSARGSGVKCSEVNKLQCHLGHVNRCHLAALVFFALFRFLFLLTLAIGCVPSLGVDLLRCVASGEKRRSLTRT